MKKSFVILIGTLAVLVAGFVIYLAIGNAAVTAQIDHEWQTTPVDKIQNLGSTRSLEILPLFEKAAANDNLVADHGVSYLIKTDHLNILLDVGIAPAILSHNMQALGVGEKDFDAVFITHNHPDHIGGAQAWDANTLIVGDPAIDISRKPVYLPTAMNQIAGQPIVVNQPTKIADGIASIGPIAFADFFPFSFIPHVLGHNTEQALAVNVEGKGIVLITGCGHQTVERMVGRAQALFNQPIAGIVGGIHYQNMTPEEIQAHITFVSALDPQLIAISPHDSTPEAMHAFQAAFPNAYQDVQVGRTISIGSSAINPSLADTSWQDFPIVDFAKVHSAVNGDANEHLIFGAIPIKPAAPNLDPNLAAFLGRWEGYDYGPPIAKDHKGVFVVQDISSQGGTAYLWAATNLQYPYWVKQIHFRVVPGAVPTIEWQGDASGHPSGATGLATFVFAYDRTKDVLKGGVNIPNDKALAGTIEFTRDQTFYVYQDYAKYLESKRIYAKPYHDQSLTQYGQGYLVYLPEGYEDQPNKTWPLIFFLHGRGDRGDNILLIAKASPFMMIRANHPLPGIIVAPLLNKSTDYPSFPQPYMAGVLAEVLKDYQVDQKRIYLTGMSMGGEAAYRFAIHQPNTFAAVAILAGFDARFNPGTIEQSFVPSTEPLAALKDLPIWALHGENDQNIPVSLAQNTVDGLRQAGVEVRFTILPKHDHDIWTDTYSDPQFYDWLFQHQRP